MPSRPTAIADGRTRSGRVPIQLAYHVPDIAAAARAAAAAWGWGPFYVLEHVRLARSLHRGRPGVFDHSSAYGQAGELMVEFITQHDDAPSALRDRFSAQESGLHHVACFVPDLSLALAEAGARGEAVALDATTVDGVRFAMVDCVASLGHMLEFYEPGDELLRFYAFIRRKAVDWTGAEPVRFLNRRA